MNKAEFDKAVAAGYVRASTHGDLTLYSYTQKAVFERHWTTVTRSARGLVLDQRGRVAARPFEKFFNLGEPEALLADLPAETPEMAVKHDGSLVICFCHEGKWRAITRGCWDNEQTRYANSWLEGNTEDFNPDWTYLFELVAPWNRIVVPHDTTDMVLIGRVHNVDGCDLSYAELADHARTLGLTPCDYLTKPIEDFEPEEGQGGMAEGYVCRYSNGLRVKLKFADYLRMHKALTGLSVKAIWEGLRAGDSSPPDGMPDEFMDWHNEQVAKLKGRFEELSAEARAAYSGARRAFAEKAKESGPLSGAVFSMLDRKNWEDAIWRLIKPTTHETFQAAEEVASQAEGGR